MNQRKLKIFVSFAIAIVMMWMMGSLVMATSYDPELQSFEQATVVAEGRFADQPANQGDLQGAAWRLYSDGVLIVDEGFINWTGFLSPWDAHRNEIERVAVTGRVIAGTSLARLFRDLTNVTTIEGLAYFDTSNVTNMSMMFSFTTSLTSLDVSNWDTSSVTNMNEMFWIAQSLENLNVSNWDTSSVTNMSNMFSGASSLTSLDMSNWDTSNVRDMRNMFWSAQSLESLDFSNWDTSNVRDMSQMFVRAESLVNLNASNWDTSQVTNMSSMFSGASNLTNLDISNWDTSNVRDMRGMFSNASSLRVLTLGEDFVFTGYPHLPSVPNRGGLTGYWQNVGNGSIDNPNGSHVLTSDGLVRQYDGTTMADTYVWQLHPQGVLATGTIGIGGAPWIWYSDGLVEVGAGFVNWTDWQNPWALDDPEGYYNHCDLMDHSTCINRIVFTGTITTGTSLSNLFQGLSGVRIIEGLEYFDTSGVTDMSTMFSWTENLTSINISNWDTSQVTNMSSMFWGASNLTNLDVSNWNTSQVTNMSSMFWGASSLINLDVSSWDTSQVTNMSSMFLSASSLINLDVSNWNTSQVANMSSMFWGASSLINLDVSNWNTNRVTNMGTMFIRASNLTSLDVSNWDTSRVTIMTNMFAGASNLTSLDVSNWDTSSVVSMNFMFDRAENLIDLDISNWDISSVTNMGAMFAGARSLTSLDVSNWSTGSVLHMNGMFSGANNLTSLDVSSWDTSSVRGMQNMFAGASSLMALDISNWDVSSVTIMDGMFSGLNSLVNLDVSNWDVSSVTNMSRMFWNASSLTSLDVSRWNTRNVTNMTNMFAGTTSLRELTLNGANFTNAGLPEITPTDDFTGYWQNPTGTHVLTSAQLLASGSRDTFVWQHRPVEVYDITQLSIGGIAGVIDQEDQTITFNIPKSLIDGIGQFRGYITELTAISDTIIFHAGGQDWPMKSGDVAGVETGDTVRVEGGAIYTIIIEHPMITSLSIGGVAGVIDQRAQTIAFTVPEDSIDSHGQFRGYITELVASSDTIIFHAGNQDWPLRLGDSAGVSADVTVHVEDGVIYTIIIEHPPSTCPIIVEGQFAEGQFANQAAAQGGLAGSEWRLCEDGTLEIGEGFINWIGIWSPWDNHRTQINTIVITGSITAGESLTSLFRNLGNTTTIEGLEQVDTSNVTNMSLIFSSANNLTNLDVSAWDMSNVRNMSWMFNETSSLTSLDVSNWDTSSVTSMSYMFSSASDLRNLDISGWDTSNVTTMSGMFDGARSLTSLNISDWDTSNVRDMSHMFRSTSSLTSLDVSAWDTSNVTRMFGMFRSTSSLTSLDISAWDTSNVTTMSGMFNGASSLTSLDISDWDTSNVRDMSLMFARSNSLTSLNVSNWDTSSVTSMSWMFQGTSSLTILAVSNWDTSNVTNMSLMFSGMSSLRSLDISNWDTSNVTDMSRMFEGTTSLRKLTLNGADFINARLPEIPPTEDFTGYWQNVGGGTVSDPTGVHVLPSADLLASGLEYKFVWQPVRYEACLTVVEGQFANQAAAQGGLAGSSWHLCDDGMLEINEGFINWTLYNGPWHNYRNDITHIVITGPITAGTSLRSLFRDLAYVTEIEGLTYFDTSLTRNMENMFRTSSALVRLDLSSFDSSNVTNMQRMFTNMRGLEELILGEHFTVADNAGLPAHLRP